MGGTFDFRITPNPNFMLDVNLDVEFDNMFPRILPQEYQSQQYPDTF